MWFFAGMNKHVLKMKREKEKKIALISILPHFPIFGYYYFSHLYPMQIGLLCKRFFADTTLVCSFTGMTLFMFPPTAMFIKCFHTNIAFICFLRCGIIRTVVTIRGMTN